MSEKELEIKKLNRSQLLEILSKQNKEMDLLMDKYEKTHNSIDEISNIKATRISKYKDLKKVNRSQLFEILEKQNKEIELLKSKFNKYMLIEEEPKADETVNDKSKKLKRSQLLETILNNNQLIDELKCELQNRCRVIDDLPQTFDIDVELKRINEINKRKKIFCSTVSVLITVCAVAILVATLWLPVLQIYGSSMTPTLNSGEIVVSIKDNEVKTGDIIAFYYNNKILVKRVIAKSGDWVNIYEDGTVAVNGTVIDEPYVYEKAYGECDLKFPYQVPEGRVFVMGDHRSVSIDSRSNQMGCVEEEQIVGKLVVRLWPWEDINTFSK